MDEKEITGRFQVEREDGSQETVVERTTYVHHRPNHRVPTQVNWYLDGSELIQDPADFDVFRDEITGETFRRIWPATP